jgi:predicted O-methyltransferase YrrM
VTSKSAFLDPAIQEYIVATTVREHPLLRELREETQALPQAQMQIGPEQGAFMQLLSRAIGARRYLELGVFTGYSTLALALALPEDGSIVACDVNEEYAATARRYWLRAGVMGKIDLRIGPALETLDRLVSRNVDPFDLAFVDADKVNVENYYDRCLRLVRPGGLMLFDNALWDGAVIDPSDNNEATLALRRLNAKLPDDPRVDVALIPLCDGLLIARKH